MSAPAYPPLSGALVLALLLSACNTRQIDTLHSLPLPEPRPTAQSWQAVQRIALTYQQQQLEFSAALAQQQQRFSVVLLDPLGRRLYSVSQEGDSISHYRDPAFPQALPDPLLLALVYFAWLPISDWQLPPHSPWSITTSCSKRQLSYRSAPVLSAFYSTPGITACPDSSILSERGARVTLSHHRQPLAMTITTVQWQPL